MNERDIELTYGTLDLAPNRQRFNPGWGYPLNYVEIRFLTDEEKAARDRRDEQARSQTIRRAAMRAIAPALTVKYCARCHRNIKPQYTHCYRCFNYLQVKARIAKGA